MPEKGTQTDPVIVTEVPRTQPEEAEAAAEAEEEPEEREGPNSNQNTRWIRQREWARLGLDRKDFSGLVVTGCGGATGDPPNKTEREGQARICGKGVADFLLGRQALLPKPKRWFSYRTHHWVVCTPVERQGIYNSWCQAHNLTHDSQGQFLDGALIYGWAAEYEAKEFLVTFRSSLVSIVPPRATSSQ